MYLLFVLLELMRSGIFVRVTRELCLPIAQLIIGFDVTESLFRMHADVKRYKINSTFKFWLTYQLFLKKNKHKQ